MGARPRSRQDALKPFLAGEGEGGAPAQSDSGGASFLGQVALPTVSALHTHNRIGRLSLLLKASGVDLCLPICSMLMTDRMSMLRKVHVRSLRGFPM